jgi:hypothetical protein
MEEILSRRKTKKQETRQRLLQIALRLFRKQGYDATPVEQITQAAGVAKGTFFKCIHSPPTPHLCKRSQNHLTKGRMMW